MDEPTPEQLLRVEYAKRAVTSEMGLRIGTAFRRVPLFETMAKRPGAITDDEISALRFYRAAFDRQERSATKSCLNFGAGGGGRDPASAIINTTPAIVEAKRKVRLCEDALGQTLSVMRAVVLHDLSFSEIAIERYGYRAQAWISVDEPVIENGVAVKVDGKPLKKAVHREKQVPRSGRHRELVRREFITGMRLLARRVRSLVSLPGIEEIWIEPRSTCAMIHRGVCAPNGLYRLWGNSGRIDDVLARVRAIHGETLTFPTPDAARECLDEADGGRLEQLHAEELSR